jgi:hypothetical protein
MVAAHRSDYTVSIMARSSLATCPIAVLMAWFFSNLLDKLSTSYRAVPPSLTKILIEEAGEQVPSFSP